ncbi:hypothetical protein [Armatimonas sp.]|uniref:hypothetical protein n=1 Tax=Armatimonas sp. TaxID=1872638 RepID=UPI003751DB11
MMKRRRFMFVFGVLITLAGCSGGGGKPSVTPPTPSPPEPVGDSYNHRVGSYEATGALADGRSVRWELSAGDDALLSARLQVGTAWGSQARDQLFYNLKNGTLALGNSYNILLDSGEILDFPFGVPVQNNNGSKPFTAGDVTVTYRRTASSAEERVGLRMTKKNKALGTEDRLTLTDRSADCNASTLATDFAFLETRYDVPVTKLGYFSAHGQITQANVSRRFYLRMDDLRKNQIEGTVFIGHGARFPVVVGSNPVQFSYYEDAPDGTIRQWDAVSGSVIFDAIDFGTSNPNKKEYGDNGKVSFHTENLRLEASNSSSDPRFVGAQGSFTLNYSGTSTVGYKRESRDYPAN